MLAYIIPIECTWRNSKGLNDAYENFVADS